VKPHAVVTPGLLTTLGHAYPLTLHFNAPKDCDELWINVRARNHWTVDAKANLPKDQSYLRAVISGILKNGKFTRTKIAQYYDLVAPGAHSATIVKYDDEPPPATEIITLPLPPGGHGQDRDGRTITFPGVVGEIHYLIIMHDGTESRVPLQNYESDRTIAPFELTFEVFAKTDEGIETQDLPPVNVQSLKTKRAVVAFIAATPRDFIDELGTASFPSHARAYWLTRSDNRAENLPFLGGILDRVIAWPASRRNGEPLGVLNIVSHGTEETWYIRKDAETEPLRGGMKGFEAADLAAGFPGKTVPDGVLSGASVVVVRACELGNDKLLLNAIRTTFGGQTTVYAPRFEILYQTRDSRPLELLAQVWRFTRPGDVSDYPSRTDIALLLESEYTAAKGDDPVTASVKQLYSDFDSKDWDDVADIADTDINGTSVRFPKYLQAISSTVENLDRADVLNTDGSRKESAILKELFPPPRRWGTFELSVLSVEPQASPAGKFRVTGVAKRTRFKLLRLLTEDERGNGKLITPDLKNPRHFGKAP
jgi:hypothetical protein